MNIFPFLFLIPMYPSTLHVGQTILTCYISSLFIRGDPYESSDAVFGVKESLVVSLQKVSDVPGLAQKYDVADSARLLKYDFVLVSDENTAALRDQKAFDAAKDLGLELKLQNGVLIRDD